MNRAGFTIVELLVTVVILALLGTTSFGVYTAFRTSNIAAAIPETILTVLSEAQAYARANVHDSSWGIYLTPTSITRFAGDTYATRDSQYDLATELPASISSTAATEVVFIAGTGHITTTTTISYIYDETADTIQISPIGVFHR